jgi:hypothetical protein
MSYLASFGRFCWDFVVGDDWRSALVTASAIVATDILVRGSVNAWWLVPVAVPLTLYVSLQRVLRSERKKSSVA